MKLKTIASIFNRNKYLTIFTTSEGEQWVCNGVAMYSLRGMPRMNPEIVLRVFDVPPDKQEKWICKESEMPTVIDYSDNATRETDIEPLKINLEWNEKTYWLFPDGRRIYSFNADYIKPLLDEPDYLTYHKRETENGGFVLACKVGFELKAIICPAVLHDNEDFAAEIKRIAGAYATMEREKVANAAYEIYGAPTNTPPPEVDPDTGEIMEGQTSLTQATL